MKEFKTICNLEMETSLEEANSIEKYIDASLEMDNFNSLNYMQIQELGGNGISICNRETNTVHQAEFITIDIDSLAPYSTLITEKEFYRIVGATKKSIGKRSGLYQEKLYARYKEAKAEEDKGYIEDVLRKAIVLENNFKFVKCLMADKRFMKEWRKCYGKQNPLFELKNSGSLRKINFVKNLIE